MELGAALQGGHLIGILFCPTHVSPRTYAPIRFAVNWDRQLLLTIAAIYFFIALAYAIVTYVVDIK